MADAARGRIFFVATTEEVAEQRRSGDDAAAEERQQRPVFEQVVVDGSLSADGQGLRICARPVVRAQQQEGRRNAQSSAAPTDRLSAGDEPRLTPLLLPAAAVSSGSRQQPTKSRAAARRNPGDKKEPDSATARLTLQRLLLSQQHAIPRAAGAARVAQGAAPSAEDRRKGGSQSDHIVSKDAADSSGPTLQPSTSVFASIMHAPLKTHVRLQEGQETTQRADHRGGVRSEHSPVAMEAAARTKSASPPCWGMPRALVLCVGIFRLRSAFWTSSDVTPRCAIVHHNTRSSLCFYKPALFVADSSRVAIVLLQAKKKQPPRLFPLLHPSNRQAVSCLCHQLLDA